MRNTYLSKFVGVNYLCTTTKEIYYFYVKKNYTYLTLNVLYAKVRVIKQLNYRQVETIFIQHNRIPTESKGEEGTRRHPPVQKNRMSIDQSYGRHHSRS